MEIVSVLHHYRRRLGPGRTAAFARVAPAPTAPPAPPRGELGENRIPVRLDGPGSGLRRLDVGPVFRIQTLGSGRQPVTIFRRPGSPDDALHEFAVPAAKPGRLLRADGLAEHARVVGRRRAWLGRRGQGANRRRLPGQSAGWP
jgi:hypothetical protein